MAATATVFLLSLTGIPLTAGFQSKFYMLMAAIKNGHHFWLVIVAVLCAAISAYYYFRIIQAMYFKEASLGADNQPLVLATDVNDRFRALLLVVAALLLILGAYPQLLIDWLHYRP